MLRAPLEDVVDDDDNVVDIEPLVEQQHPARSLMAASLISARDGRPLGASCSSTGVATLPRRLWVQLTTRLLAREPGTGDVSDETAPRLSTVAAVSGPAALPAPAPSPPVPEPGAVP